MITVVLHILFLSLLFNDVDQELFEGSDAFHFRIAAVLPVTIEKCFGR